MNRTRAREAEQGASGARRAVLACWVTAVAAVCPGVLRGADAPASAHDALAFYNADASARAQIQKRIRSAVQVALSRVELHGWWGKLVNEPSKRPGMLCELESAGPVGFSRADHDAAVYVKGKKKAIKTGTVCGVLEPTGLAFDHPVKLVRKRYLRVPVPASVLAPGEYKLKLCVTAGDRSEAVELPVTIGPYVHHDRYHAYYWLSGSCSRKVQLEQIRRAKRLNLSVVDTSFLPGVDVLRQGLLASAHEVTIHQNQVKGTAGKEPYLTRARDRSAAIGDTARRFSHVRWCLPNSEYGAGYLMPDPVFQRQMQEEAKVSPTRLRWHLPRRGKDKKLPYRFRPVLDKRVAPLAAGVYSHKLPEIRAARFTRREGCGWYRLNRLAADVIRARPPHVAMWTDPVYHVEQFEGMDVVSFWEYSTNPYRLLWFIKQGDCVRRLTGARNVHVTLSQWFLDVRGPAVKGKRPPVMRSPDYHRLYAWTVIAEPTHMIGYWALDDMDKHPACADGLAKAMREVAYPYGTLLRGTEVAPSPVAIYLSTVGDFLGRTDRPYNYWSRHHYLTGVVPALIERFKNRVVMLDDGDILTRRHKAYRMLICPILRATTDRLRSALHAYQQAGGCLVGDGLWRVAGLVPDDTFPGKSTEQRKMAYRTETIRPWHEANRKDILKWQPKGWDALCKQFDVDSPTPDVILSLRRSGDVTYAVAVNARMARGKWAEKFGITDPRYRDTGVAQDVEVLLKAPQGAAVYDAIHGRRLKPDEYQGTGDRIRIAARLPGAGAGLWVVRPRPIAALRLDAGAPGPVRAGTLLTLNIKLLDDRDQPITGQTAVALTVTDAAGGRCDASGLFPVRDGLARIPLGINLNAKPGTWTVEARDVTSGLCGRLELPVVAR